MKKVTGVIFLFLIVNFNLKAQLYNWTKAIGSGGNDAGSFVTVDENTGNVYILGGFEQTIDLNPGSGVYNLTCNLTSGFLLPSTPAMVI